ncbi:MAG: hypothetical protein JSV18_06445 [Candidatus Bathyarchaeota archaeon]|nr:MAG: hypothetical protein JSV18_06445 [Candidatus Bathyarchaeota archaeon]
MVRTSIIKGSNRAVAIGGFRGVPVRDVEGLLARLDEAVSPSVFQIFDARMVAGWGHLFFATVNAVRAFETGTAISRSLGIEALLYASCRDQISQALDLMGVTPATERVALLVLADDPGLAKEAFERASRILGEEDDSVLKFKGDKFEEIRGIFGVSDAELEAVGGPREEALTRLLVERGALLPLRR